MTCWLVLVRLAVLEMTSFGAFMPTGMTAGDLAQGRLVCIPTQQVWSPGSKLLGRHVGGGSFIFCFSQFSFRTF